MAVMSDIDNSPKRIHRLLCQATFGANKKDLEAVKVIGFRQWYDNQSKVKPSLHLPLSIEFTPDFEKKNRVRGTARLGAWWRNSLEGEDQVRQRMAFALSQIFVVSENGASNHQLLASYYDLLVKHALENFRDLFYDVTLHTAMGRFLTLRGSRKANIKKNTFPDENYARECMQLFTLGLWLLNDDGTPKLDPSGRKIPAYTQEDVEELSRVLTGWSGGSSTSPMISKSRHHDKGEKTVLGAIFKPKQSAEQDLSQAVDLLFNHPNTPPFIANLLIKRFVASNPRPEFIQRVATVFKNNGKGVRGDLKATLFAILTDPDAVNGVAAGNDEAARHRHFGKLKEPIIAIANQARALGMRSQRKVWRDISTAKKLGQAPLAAPSVFNFYTPDFAPQGEISDIGLTAPEFKLTTSNYLLQIQNLIWQMSGATGGGRKKLWAYDASDFLKAQKTSTDLVALVDERFFGQTMSDALRQRLIKLLDNSLNRKPALSRVRGTLYVALTSPEFFAEEAIV